MIVFAPLRATRIRQVGDIIEDIREVQAHHIPRALGHRQIAQINLKASASLRALEGADRPQS